MKIIHRKPSIFISIFVAFFIITACFFWEKNFWDIFMKPVVGEYTLEEKLRQQKMAEINKSRDEFPSLEDIENIIDYDALLRTGHEVPIIKELEELNTNEKVYANQLSQKKIRNEITKIKSKRTIEESKGTSTGHYSVQIAALSNALTAEKIVNQLSQEGFHAYIEQVERKNEKMLFRIRVGMYDNRIDAEKMLEHIFESGRTGFITKH